VRLAVFTSKYPARIATFFERDMRALLEAGVDLEIFSLYPLDGSLWHYSLDAQSGDGRLRERSRHLGVAGALRGAAPTLWRSAKLCARQTSTVLPAAARFGPVAFAKTAYVLPKAWAWAAERGAEFDHVLAYWGNYAGTCAWAFHQAVGRATPFSIWLHAGTDLYTTPIHLRAKLLYADNIITCCAFNRTYLREHFADIHARIEHRVHVCHHGLDLREYPFGRTDRDPQRVVAVGRLSAYKGFEYLLRAIATLRNYGRNVELELVGGGELRGELERQAAELGIAEAVTFRGWVEHPEARAAIRAGAILVHPSDGLGDGLPNVVREAMALGTPVIASDVAGIPDALGQGCGVLVPPRDPAALASAIGALLDDPARQEAIAEAARRRAEREYDVWVNGRRLAHLLEHTGRQPTRVLPRPREVMATA
jgi:colanic acid/amylovoran biosynthesis glycosyltransferase